MGKPAFVLAIGLALLASVAAGPPAPSKLSDFGEAALGTSWNKLPAALQPSQSCLAEQAKTNAPCEATDSAGVTYVVRGDHLSAKEIRRADPLAQLPDGFSWSDTPADGDRKMREAFQLKTLKVQRSADGTVIDTGNCFLARRGGEYFRFYLRYDASQQLKTLGVALCVYL
jgi:hypothetical protein